MIRWEIVVVLGLAFLDMMLTYYLLYLSKTHGQKDWENNEQNMVVRALLKRFGLHNGVRIGATSTLIILTGLIFFMNYRYNWYDFSRFMFFFIGAYSMVIMYHTYYLKSMKRQIENGPGTGSK